MIGRCRLVPVLVAVLMTLVSTGAVRTGVRAAPGMLDSSGVSRVRAVGARLQARENMARSAGKSARAIALYRQNVQDAHGEANQLKSPRQRGVAAIQIFPYEIRAASALALLDLCGERAGVRVAVQDVMRFDLDGSVVADRDFERGRLADGFREYRQLLFPAPGRYGFNAVFVERGPVTNLNAGLNAAIGGRFDEANRIFAAQDRVVPRFRYPALFLGILRMGTDPADAVRRFKKVLEIPPPAEPDSSGYDGATVSALVLLASPSLKVRCAQ